jgi:hypothetical protein
MKRKVTYFEIKVETTDFHKRPYLVVWIGREHRKYRRDDDEIYFPPIELLPTLQRLQNKFVRDNAE